jgi:glutamate N-acetyltransferase/amino-acid N-acetyltransferase
VALDLGEVRVVENGAPREHDRRAVGRAVGSSEVRITLDLNAGDREAVMHTCDLTADYVRINAEYST